MQFEELIQSEIKFAREEIARLSKQKDYWQGKIRGLELALEFAEQVRDGSE